MQEIKYGYTAAIYCDINRYTCLMPVEYKKETDGYKKVQMVCNQVERGECNKETSCKHFLSAKEFMDDYLLKDKKM